MAKKMKLYYMDFSPSSRSVKYVAEQLKLDFEIIDIAILKNEQKTDEYLKMNPLQTIPTLIDDDVIISDSHAIMMYLVDKYGKNDSLYPKDLVKRAKVNTILFFETQFLFGRIRAAIEPVYYDGKADFYPYLLEKIPDSLNRFNRMLSHGHKFITGDEPTIADFSCLPTTNNINGWEANAEEKYANITEWRKRMFELYPEIEKRESETVGKTQTLTAHLLSIRQKVAK